MRIMANHQEDAPNVPNLEQIIEADRFAPVEDLFSFFFVFCFKVQAADPVTGLRPPLFLPVEVSVMDPLVINLKNYNVVEIAFIYTLLVLDSVH